MAAAQNAVDDLAAHLAVWQRRTVPDAAARAAANDALDALDAALAGLHRLRLDLTGQMRDADDETARRVDALLGGAPPGKREGGPPAEEDRPCHTVISPSPPGAASSPLPMIASGGDSSAETGR